MFRGPGMSRHSRRSGRPYDFTQGDPLKTEDGLDIETEDGFWLLTE